MFGLHDAGLINNNVFISEARFFKFGYTNSKNPYFTTTTLWRESGTISVKRYQQAGIRTDNGLALISKHSAFALIF